MNVLEVPLSPKRLGQPCTRHCKLCLYVPEIHAFKLQIYTLAVIALVLNYLKTVQTNCFELKFTKQRKSQSFAIRHVLQQAPLTCTFVNHSFAYLQLSLHSNTQQNAATHIRHSAAT